MTHDDVDGGLVAVVLAAGASARLGQPKALVELGGRSVLESLLAGALACCARAVVVAGAHHREVSEHLAGLVQRRIWDDRVVLLHHADWRLGRTGSLAAGVRAAAARDVLVAPVDVPRVRPATFVALCGAWRAAGRPARGWLAPCSRTDDGTARHGHPILIGRALAAQVAGLPPEAPLRELRAVAAPLVSVDVDDASVLEDLDSPEDLARLEQRARAEHRPPGA